MVALGNNALAQIAKNHTAGHFPAPSPHVKSLTSSILGWYARNTREFNVQGDPRPVTENLISRRIVIWTRAVKAPPFLVRKSSTGGLKPGRSVCPYKSVCPSARSSLRLLDPTQRDNDLAPEGNAVEKPSMDNCLDCGYDGGNNRRLPFHAGYSQRDGNFRVFDNLDYIRGDTSPKITFMIGSSFSILDLMDF